MSLLRRLPHLAMAVALLSPVVGAQSPTPPAPPAPPSPPGHIRSDDRDDDRDDDHDDDRDDDRDDDGDMRADSGWHHGRHDRDVERRVAADVRAAMREAAREAHRAIADAMPQVAMAGEIAESATRSALRSTAPLTGHWGRSWRDDAATEETIDTTMAFAASGGVVDLGIVSGSITVRGWSRAEARVHATSESPEITFDHTASRITMDVRRRHGDDDAELDLTVPYGTRVLMRSTDGDLHALDVRGAIEARTVSGGVDVSDANGPATIETVSGDVRARHITGPLRVNAISGDVELGTIAGDVDASTVSGDIALPDARSRIVRMESVSGDLTFGGPMDPAGRYDFRSHSGSVTLRMPGDAGAALSLETFSGEIDTDFKLLVGGNGGGARSGGHHIDSTIGGGGAHVTVETFSGDVRLERAGPHTSE